MKKICFFGSYEKELLPTRLKSLLKTKNVEVVECQYDVHSFSQLIKSYFSLWKQHRGIDYSVMIIPWRGIMTLPLAKLISKGSIIWFPYVEIYDALINDRKKFRKGSIAAKVIRFVEKTALRISDIVVVQSNEDIDYFCKVYNISETKFRRFTWASDEKQFPPQEIKEPGKIFKILYFGKFIPFHNVNVIIYAADLLKKHRDIQFVFCGKGQTTTENMDLAKKLKLQNVDFKGWVTFKELQEEIKNSDVGVGAFADASVRPYTVPGKIFQVLSSRKPLITRDNKVMKELRFKNKENCILTIPNDPKDLADAILFLKNNPELTKSIAQKGYEVYKEITTESWNNFWETTLEPLLIEDISVNK